MKATALVLAGRRSGTHDPLAHAAGVPLKCMVPVAGKALIEHVVDALAGSDLIGEIRVVVDEADLLRAHSPFTQLIMSGRMTFVPAQFNLVDSVIGAVADAQFPVMITTADSVMLTTDTVDEFVRGASQVAGGAAVAMARKEAVIAAHPEGQRRFYNFEDGSFSNCNTYWLGDIKALQAAETFRSGGQFVKYPMRIARAFGILNLIRFKFGMGTVGKTFERFSRRFGFPIRMIELSDGAAAIDVDNERTFRIASLLLEKKA